MIYLVAFMLIRYVGSFSPDDVVNFLGALVIIQVILLMPPLTYIYESMLARRVTEKEQKRLDPIIKRILFKTGSKIAPRVIVLDSYDPNMAAFNKNTLIVNKVCLKSFNDDELGGLLCHELGHLHYRHSGGVLVHYINSIFVNASLWLMNFVYNILTTMAKLHWLLTLVVWPFIAAMFVMLALPLWLMATIINAGASAAWRNAEYEADGYAHRYGFGNGLISALGKLEAYEKEPEDWWAKVMATHPPMAHRIDRLETS